MDSNMIVEVQHSGDQSDRTQLAEGISQDTVDEILDRAASFGFPRKDLFLLIYESSGRPHATCKLQQHIPATNRIKTVHTHAVDGKDKYTEVLHVMLKTVTRGYYKEIRVLGDSKTEGVERLWVPFKGGKKVRVDDFNNMEQRPFGDREKEPSG